MNPVLAILVGIMAGSAPALAIACLFLRLNLHKVRAQRDLNLRTVEHYAATLARHAPATVDDYVLSAEDAETFAQLIYEDGEVA